MLRISRLTDYGTVVLAQLASEPAGFASAADVAAATGLGLPTVSKLLKKLAKSGLVDSIRGSHGGYRLVRDARYISAAEVIDALEGPVSITDCSTRDRPCDLEATCSVGGSWQRINRAIRQALDEISLADLKRTNGPLPQFRFAGTRVHIERKR